MVQDVKKRQGNKKDSHPSYSLVTLSARFPKKVIFFRFPATISHEHIRRVSHILPRVSNRLQ